MSSDIPSSKFRDPTALAHLVDHAMRSFCGILATAINLQRQELLPHDHFGYHANRLRAHVSSIRGFLAVVNGISQGNSNQSLGATIAILIAPILEIESVIAGASKNPISILSDLPNNLAGIRQRIFKHLAGLRDTGVATS